jgi:hypothetical protein
MKRKKIWVVLVIYLFNINLFSETLVLEKNNITEKKILPLSENIFSHFKRLKRILIDEYEDILLIKNIKYSNEVVKYYGGTYIEDEIGDSFQKVIFKNSISLEDRRNIEVYDKVIYKNNQPIEVSTIDKDNGIIQKGYFDKDGRIVKIHNYQTNTIVINKLNGRESIDTILCNLKTKKCTINYLIYQEYINSSKEHYIYIDNNLSNPIRAYQYFAMQKRKELEKESKLFFDNILKNDYDERYKIEKVFIPNSNEKFSLWKYRDKSGRVVKVVNFETRNIIEYIYYDDGHINEVGCDYTKDQCYLRECK